MLTSRTNPNEVFDRSLSRFRREPNVCATEPKNTQDTLPKAYLGISLGRLYYSTARLNDYCAWAAINAPPDFAFLIGDDIHAFTLQAFSNLSASTALSRARQKGGDIERQLNRIGTARGLQFTVIRWHDLAVLGRYETILTAALALRDRDPKFRHALRQQALSNLKRRLQQIEALGLRSEKKWDLLETYVVHEIAGLITMSEDIGYAIEVYPGPDLDVMQQIYNGHWNEIRLLLPENPVRKFFRLELD